MSVKGIDISIWQSDLTDYSALKGNGIEFAICKLSEGQAKDWAFDQHYTGLKANNIPVGAYVFSHATNESKAKAEAEFAVKALAGRGLDLPIFLDMEAEDINSGWNAPTTHIALAFGEAIKATGYKWGVYASRSWWQHKMDIDAVRAAGGVVWCAEYGVAECKIACDIWQYADNGKIPEYKHKLDMNIMYSTELLNKPAAPSEDTEQENPKEKEEAVMSIDTAIAALVARARGEVGYLEKRTNAQLDDKTGNAGYNNWNKYARDIDAQYPNFYNGRKNGYAWCDIFTDWCFIQTFGYENALKLLCASEKSTGAGCKYSARFYREKGQFYTSPKVGDQIFFGPLGGETHTGIVVDVKGDYVYTVEGNTSPSSGVVANGGGVYEKSYNMKTQYIPGYGRPNYSIVASNDIITGGNDEIKAEPSKPETETTGGDSKMCTINLPVLRQGANNGYVIAAQAVLIKRGFPVGVWGTDGDFGAKTHDAVAKFQTRHKLEADGIIGAQTWAALLKG